MTDTEPASTTADPPVVNIVDEQGALVPPRRDLVPLDHRRGNDL